MTGTFIKVKTSILVTTEQGEVPIGTTLAQYHLDVGNAKLLENLRAAIHMPVGEFLRTRKKMERHKQMPHRTARR